MSKGKSFIRVHYSSTSLLSCTARIVNSCPSYTKQSAFKTKQYLSFFKFSWSHIPSTSQAHHLSSFLNIAITTRHMELQWYSALVLNLQESYHLEKATGLWCWQIGTCVLWKTTSITPACSPQKASEGIDELSRSNVLKSTRLFIFRREASQGPCWNLNHRAQLLCGH